jgi:Flp pilus assembly protein TadG
MTSRRCRAQALIWLTLALPVFVSLAGLAIDGGVLITTRRQLQSVADGAARAGATRVDASLLRSSGGSEVQLDHTQANDAARTYLHDALSASTLGWQSPPDAQIEVGVRRIHVSVRASLKTAFLRIVHIDSMPVEASSFADLQFGIHDGGGG